MRKRQQLAPQPDASSLQLVDIPEVAKRLSVGRTKVYELIKRDGLPSVKLGNATRVSLTSLQKWIEQREQAS